MRIDRAAPAISLFAVSAMLVVAPAVAAGEDDIPRTAGGKPDLTGRYNIASSTPFERPSEFGDKLFLTVEEAEEIMERSRAAVARSYAASDPERSAPPAGGDGFPGADPDYTAPCGGEFLWPQTEELNYEYACHEDNYAMGNILRGARLLEREYLEQKGQAGSTGSGDE